MHSFLKRKKNLISWYLILFRSLKGEWNNLGNVGWGLDNKL